MVKLHCKAGDHYWLRKSQRGCRPANCPECNEKLALAREDNRPLESEADRLARMASMRETKAERAQERAQRARQQEVERKARIAEQLPAIHERWNRAFRIAMREDTEAAWKHADQLMLAYITAKKGITNDS